MSTMAHLQNVGQVTFGLGNANGCSASGAGS